MTPRQRALRAIERISFALGVLCLGAYSAGKAEAWLFDLRQEERLGHRSAAVAPLVDPTIGLRRVAATEEVWGLIEIPRLSLRAYLAEGVDAKTLRVAVGHVPKTAFPDEVGNVALAGHRDSLFRPLRQLVLGDVVALSTPRGSFEYVIDAIEVVAPNRVDVIAHRPGHVLTLVTCYPFDFIGPAPLRLVAHAHLTRRVVLPERAD